MINSIFKLDLNIKFCHACFHDKDWQEQKTKFDYTIWNVFEGNFFIKIHGKTFKVEAGDIVVFYPGDTYSAWADNSNCIFIATFFSIDTGSAVNIMEKTPSAGIYKGEEVYKINHDFACDCLQLELAKKEMGLETYASFLTMFSKLVPMFGTQVYWTNSLTTDGNVKLNSLLEHIERNPGENISTKDMASYMGMSDKYFSSFFHVHTGMTPKQFATKTKMQYATSLLSDENLSLSDVAQALGFADAYSFSKAFKKYFGEAPGGFRKNL